MYCKKVNEAEQILLQARLFYRAIKMNIKLYRWERAMDIATKNNTHVDTVLAYRSKFLQQHSKEEDIESIKKLTSANNFNTDWSVIKLKIRQEKEKEASMQ